MNFSDCVHFQAVSDLKRATLPPFVLCLSADEGAFALWGAFVLGGGIEPDNGLVCIGSEDLGLNVVAVAKYPCIEHEPIFASYGTYSSPALVATSLCGSGRWLRPEPFECSYSDEISGRYSHIVVTDDPLCIRGAEMRDGRLLVGVSHPIPPCEYGHALPSFLGVLPLPTSRELFELANRFAPAHLDQSILEGLV